MAAAAEILEPEDWYAQDGIPEMLDELGIDGSVGYFIYSHGLDFPKPWQRPLIQTPTSALPDDAVFDEERVEKVLRVCHALRHTAGEWAGRPLDPDPWQVAYVIAPIFGWVHPDYDGRYVRCYTNVWVELPRKNGKLLDSRTPILTADGWKTMGTVAEGDYVHTLDGSLTCVTAVSETQYPVSYRIVFSDGQEFIAGADHQWTLFDRYGHDPESWKRDRSRGCWKTIDTDELFRTYRCGSRGDTRYSVRTDRTIQRPDADLPLSPYLLGLWLGDGSKGCGGFTGIDGLEQAFVSSGYRVTSAPDEPKRHYISGLIPHLRDAGVLNDKHVPERYLLASESQRLALLQGLMDTDGSAVKTGTSGAAAVEFCNTNRQLAESVLFLARSLGWKPVFKEARATLYGKDCGPKYRVIWTAYRERSPFRLARKTSVLCAQPSRPTRASTNTIKLVERVPTVPMRCIEVAHPSRQYLVGRGLTPTHNTTLAAAVAIYMTTADSEPGAQVIVGATTKDQAGYCFRPIAQLAVQSPVLSKHVQLYRSAQKIIHEASGSYFQAISSVAEAQHGANLHCAVIDEVHLHKTSDLVEALETGTASRRQPLVWMITTADEGRPGSIYSRRRKRIEQLSDGVIHDPSQYGVIWAAARSERELDDPFSADTQRRANPGYGTSPTARYLADAARKAQDSPADYANYLRLHLGIRTKQTTRYITLSDWDDCDGEVNEEDLIGQECYGGLDLASVSDITAFCLTFPDYANDRYSALWRLWIPERALDDLDKRTAGEARVWVDQGWLTVTEGDIVDYRVIISQIKDDSRKFRLHGVAHDRWGAPGIIRELNEDTIETVAVYQGYSGMSGSMNEMLRLVRSRRYSHGGNPVARWSVDNLMVDIDAAGAVRPNKGAAMDKIDPFVAAVMSLGECLIQGSDLIESKDAVK